MKIEIKSSSLPLIHQLKEGNEIEGVSVEIPPIYERRDLGGENIALAIITLAASVPAGLFTAFLYDKIKGKSAKITINRKEVHIDKGEIRRVIEESIKIENSG